MLNSTICFRINPDKSHEPKRGLTRFLSVACRRPSSRALCGHFLRAFFAATSFFAAALILSTWSSSTSPLNIVQARPALAPHRGQTNVIGLMVIYSGSFAIRRAWHRSRAKSEECKVLLLAQHPLTVLIPDALLFRFARFHPPRPIGAQPPLTRSSPTRARPTAPPLPLLPRPSTNCTSRKPGQ